VAKALQRRALREGARLMGSEARLRDMLGAAPEAFVGWTQGEEAMPYPTFAMLLDFLSDMESPTLPPQ
jgi:hypothetical protein